MKKTLIALAALSVAGLASCPERVSCRMVGEGLVQCSWGVMRCPYISFDEQEYGLRVFVAVFSSDDQHFDAGKL